MFNFNEEIEFNMDVKTSYMGKTLILKNVYLYDGPVTMQKLPYGGIQSVFGYNLIITTKSGFICPKEIIYDDKKYSVKEFILKFPNLVNEVLPN